MTKIERVIREVSDLRDFYLKVQAARRKARAKDAPRKNAARRARTKTRRGPQTAARRR